jgi:putative ABC transport system permease protein
MSVLQASRALVRRPAFSAAAILTLAAGIAVTTAMFAIIDTILLKPLPFPNADRLVTVYEASPARRESTSLVAPVRLEEWTRLGRTFELISGTYTENVTETSGAAPERLAGRRTMPGFLVVYGVAPVAGRTFTADEEHHGGPRAVVISEAFWQRRFARNGAAVGSRLLIGGDGYTIVGVLPRSFTSAETDVWIPAQLHPLLASNREARFVGGVGRLKAGVTIDEARADLARVQQLLGAEHPKTDAGWSVAIEDLKSVRIRGFEQRLVIVFSAVAVLLLIGMANVAGLMLVQLRRRSAELAIRTAIGASRARVIGAVMQEAMIVVVAAGVLGSAAATSLVAVASRIVEDLPRSTELAVDWRAAAFAIAVSALAALALGLLPALHATRRSPSQTLAASGRSQAGGGHRFQSALVCVQIALSLVLAGSAGLLLRSYQQLGRTDLGFTPDQAVTFHVGARWDEDRGRIAVMQEQLLTELAAIPGVVSAGFANFLPATGATLRYQIQLEGAAGEDPQGRISVGYRTISSGYLEALQTPLLTGERCPQLRARVTGVAFALVNRRFAERHGSGQNLIGRRFKMEGFPGADWRIIGIVGDMVEDGVGTQTSPYVYACAGGGMWPDPEYVVRAAGDPLSVMASIRETVRRVDGTRPIFGVRPVGEVIADALEAPRVNSSLLTAFAAFALGLAALGLYGLLMLYVMERRREMGIRMALGAAPRDVLRLVLGDAARLAAVGLPLGMALTWLAGRALQGVLYGVTPFDPQALAGAACVLAAAIAVAAWIPAHRAAGVSAMEAMRID